MGSLGFVEHWTGVAWVGYLQVCALCNLTLRLLYQRSRPRADQWRVWALWFTAINFAGGIGFGWAPLGLTIGGRLDVIDLFPNTIYGVSLDAPLSHFAALKTSLARRLAMGIWHRPLQPSIPPL